MNKEIVMVAVIAILLTTVLATTSPAIYVNAKHHRHLTDTQKEDSTATDKQGQPCDLGPDHDQCKDQFLESQGFPKLGKHEHFGTCENGDAEHPIGTDCDIVNDSDN